MELIATLYDSEGNEIELKPGHVIVMGKESCAQVPMEEYSAKFIYKPPDGGTSVELQSEWGSIGNIKFPSSDGGFVEWGNNPKFLNSLKEHEKNNEKILGCEDRESTENS
jgi:hypothetical protein